MAIVKYVEVCEKIEVVQRHAEAKKHILMKAFLW